MYRSATWGAWEDFKYWWDDWGVLVGFLIFFVAIIGLVIYAGFLRYEHLYSIGCRNTPVDWKNGTFYVTDDNMACPYGGK